jgi:type IV secretion system protein VirB4
VRAGRRPGTQIVLDMDSSHEQTILANEGSYTSIGGNGQDSGVVPHLMTNTPALRAMLRAHISSLTRIDGAPAPDAEELQGIREGVDFLMNEMPPAERHLGVVRDFMGFAPDGAGARLERWTRQYNGDLAWVFDGREHRVNLDVELVGLNMTAIINDDVVMGPMGQMILWMASEMMDGRRCIVWCEEAPAYFERPEFSRGGKAIALRARKRNACFKAIAQMPEHLLSNEAGKAIIKQSRHLVLFPFAGAERDDYVNGLGVPEPVYEMVRKGMFELPYHSMCIARRDGESSVVRFDLTALQEYIATFSATTNSVRLFRSILAKHPDRSMKLNLEEFWRRLPEAAA